MNKEEFKKWDLNEAKRFLECFAKEEDSESSKGKINIRIFSDKKGTGFKGRNLSFNMKEFTSRTKILMAHNEAERGIFFVVNSGGNSDSKINKINAQFFECDTLSLEEQMENISNFPLEPSIIVQTRKSLHVYFLIKDGKVEKFREIQRKLAKYFNGDGSCINESRVMRVPGFYHCKEEPVRVKCIKFTPNLFYTQEDLERKLSYSESEFIVNDDKFIKKKDEKEYYEASEEEFETIKDNSETEKHKYKAEKYNYETGKEEFEDIGDNSETEKYKYKAEKDNYETSKEEYGAIKDNYKTEKHRDKTDKEKLKVEKESYKEEHDIYISNNNKNLQESTLINRENISENNEEVINNKSKEQELFNSRNNLHNTSYDNIPENIQVNIINKESNHTEDQLNLPEQNTSIKRDKTIKSESISSEKDKATKSVRRTGSNNKELTNTPKKDSYSSEKSEKAVLKKEKGNEGDEKNKNSQNGLEVVCFKCDFIKHCKENSENLSEPLWHGMITNLAHFKGGNEKIHEFSKIYKGYSEKETNGKIFNFLKSESGPMTCKTLKDRGYICKKYGKTCNGKSPAALAFKSLNVQDLRACIKALNFSEFSKAINVDTALRFIENFMYNTGVPLGKSIIKEDLCNHLKIKDSKDLIAFYRDVIKKHNKEIEEKKNKNKKNTQKVNSNEGNLPWYEEQDKGLRFLPFILAKHLSDIRDVFYSGESFLIYENGVYNITGEKEAGRIIMDYMLPNYCNMGAIRDCRDQWDILISKDFDDFNRNPYIVNTKNGLLNIKDGSFKEHTPTYLSTVQLNVRYNPQADCPQFKKFLSEVVDCTLIPLVQEIVGYLLTTNTAAQKSFVFWGPARTGKSTLLWVIEYLLLGKKNVSNIPWQDIGDKFKTAELLGKLANVFSDLPSKSIDDTGIFKVLTGEDYLMAEKKNKNPFKFKPFSRLVFSCNELPRNYVDRTEGFYRRLIIVPFNRQIEKSKVDKNLKLKFQNEKEGILNWALEGLRRLYKNNFEFSENEITDNIKNEYKHENNNPLLFARERCEIGVNFSCSRKELYESYRDYCDEFGLRSLSQVKFNNEIERSFPVIKKRLSNSRIWIGIRMKNEDVIL